MRRSTLHQIQIEQLSSTCGNHAPRNHSRALAWTPTTGAGAPSALSRNACYAATNSTDADTVEQMIELQITLG
ncbi:hypothetical protein KALB_2399 [Kutzneria albida DSM 43870]|uniref:Uncharacterized protein n=1 Tax=Kutzneria albida DSM 43870 TaxID=1449976 RepID=W5W4G6_9PSEU|nr:hypothetical protein KALB_2399 [Kutzneria albida DSM 43870]